MKCFVIRRSLLDVFKTVFDVAGQLQNNMNGFDKPVFSTNIILTAILRLRYSDDNRRLKFE